MVASNRTANTTFYPSNDPTVIRARANVANGDWIFLPYSHPVDVIVSNQDNDDVVVSCDLSSNKITFGCVDDEGNAVTSQFDVIVKAILRTQ